MPQFIKTVKGIMTTDGLAGIDYSAIVDAPNIEQMISDATTNTEGVIYQELAKKLDATDGKAADSVLFGGQAPEYYAKASDLTTLTGTTVPNLQKAIDGKAPNDHASSATTYGVATSEKYGHVKISDVAIHDAIGANVASDVAASTKAVADNHNTMLEYYEAVDKKFDDYNMKVYTSFEQLGFTGIRGSNGYLNSNCPTPKQVFDKMPAYSMLIMLTNQDNHNLKNYWTNLPANKGFIEFVKIYYSESTSTGRSRLTFWDTTTNVGYISSVTANIPDGITWNKMLTTADFALSGTTLTITL